MIVRASESKSLLLPRPRRNAWAAVEDLDQLRWATLQRFGETKQHPERRSGQSSFELANEGSTRARRLSELRLRQPARRSELAQVSAEHFAFIARGQRQVRFSR